MYGCFFFVRPKKKQDVCQYLPPELMINILSRLPIRSIIRFKCVCKSWLDLIESCEFCRSHLCNSKSIRGLAFFEGRSRQYHFYKYVDEHEHEHEEPDERYFSMALKFRLPANLNPEHIQDSSVNGLLLFSMPHNYFICNPLTRDYIKLPSSSLDEHYEPDIGFGFGVSRISGEHKIVMVTQTKCEVYTLGTGSWRSVAPCCHHCTDTALFLNGNLHWLLHDPISNTVLEIVCFDLETELFTIFSPPPSPHPDGCYWSLSSLEESLVFCYYAYGDFAIWLMNEYGDDKSWTRKLVIHEVPGCIGCGDVLPVKLFRDGDDMLIVQVSYKRLLCYINKTNHIIDICDPLLSRDFRISMSRAVSYTPSFLPLRTFTMENVSSF